MKRRTLFLDHEDLTQWSHPLYERGRHFSDGNGGAEDRVVTSCRAPCGGSGGGLCENSCTSMSSHGPTIDVTTCGRVKGLGQVLGPQGEDTVGCLPTTV